MASKEKVELVQLAIQQLMEEERRNKKAGLTSSLLSSDESSFVAVGDDDDHRLLSRLLSQLETLKEDCKLQQLELSADPEESFAPAVDKVEPKKETLNCRDSGSSEIGRKEIVEELRNVKRQNFITHCLLSVMIVLTVTWQVSEVSLILKLRDGLSHPFRSFGSMLTGILRGRNINGQEGEQQSPAKHSIDNSSLPGLKTQNSGDPSCGVASWI